LKHDRLQRRHHGAHDCLDGLFNRRAVGLSEAVLNVALCGSVKGHLAAPGAARERRYQRPMPSPPLPPRDSHALVARDGFRALAGGAKLE
jgi:hypothetical protein